jgi:hypothetical protein
MEEILKQIIDEKSYLKIERWDDDWLVTLSIDNEKRQLHCKGENLKQEIAYLRDWRNSK